MGHAETPPRLPASTITAAPPRRRALFRGLGWLSVAIGVAETLAPRRMARAIGVDVPPAVLRVLGLRELASGAGILGGRDPERWSWSRVAGDVMDLALLGAAFRGADGGRDRLRAATAGVAAVTALDLLAVRRAREANLEDAAEQVASASITVNRPASEIFQRWRRLDELPRIMPQLESVYAVDAAGGHGDRRWRWVMRAGDETLAWNAEIVEERPNAMLAWRGDPDAETAHEGVLELTPGPGGRGTEVRVTMRHQPQDERIAKLLTLALGTNPSGRLKEDLRRFKRLIETGEIPTTQGQPAGRRSPVGRGLERLEREAAS